MLRPGLVLVSLVACGGGAQPVVTRSPAPQPPIAVPVRGAVVAPQVTDPAVVSRDEGPPPVVVLVDAQGQRRLAAAGSWGEVAAGAWSAGPKTAGVEASSRAILESALLGRSAKETVDGFADYRVEADRRSGAEDDPPPPEEADDDESGGTGTAMALEEGKMGRKDASPRGAWRGPLVIRPPGRYADVIGLVSNDKLAGVPAVVIPNPTTKAASVVRAVAELGALIGVWSAGQLRPLRIQFHRDREHEREPGVAWLDLELAASLTLDGKPVEAAALVTALADARQRHRLPADATVDLLVGPEVEAQRLVDTLVALDRAGTTSIGLGLIPSDAERKANLPPVVADGLPNTQGSLDRDVIRRVVKQQLPKLRYCYEKALLASPGLQGTVRVMFFIAPTGKVASASATGISPDVASCVTAVLKSLTFPPPKGGGGVQVNYPFTFRPEGVGS